MKLPKLSPLLAEIVSAQTIVPQSLVCSQRSPLPTRCSRRNARRSTGNPWSGSYVYNSGNLVLDLQYNLMLEATGRLQKCRLYEMTSNKTARGTIAYLIAVTKHTNAPTPKR